MYRSKRKQQNSSRKTAAEPATKQQKTQHFSGTLAQDTDIDVHIPEWNPGALFSKSPIDENLSTNSHLPPDSANYQPCLSPGVPVDSSLYSTSNELFLDRNEVRASPIDSFISFIRTDLIL